MKTKFKVKVPSPRKDVSVRFRCGAGAHEKAQKAQRAKIRVGLKKGQEVFQRAS